MDWGAIKEPVETEKTFCIKCLSYKNGKYCNHCGTALCVKPDKCAGCKTQHINHYDTYCKNCGARIPKEVIKILKGLDDIYSDCHSDFM
jgi:hypothetical protein